MLKLWKIFKALKPVGKLSRGVFWYTKAKVIKLKKEYIISVIRVNIKVISANEYDSGKIVMVAAGIGQVSVRVALNMHKIYNTRIFLESVTCCLKIKDLLFSTSISRIHIGPRLEALWSRLGGVVMIKLQMERCSLQQSKAILRRKLGVHFPQCVEINLHLPYYEGMIFIVHILFNRNKHRWESSLKL